MEHVGSHVLIGGQPLKQPRNTQAQWCAAFNEGLGSPCTRDPAQQAVLDHHDPWKNETAWALTMLGRSPPPTEARVPPRTPSGEAPPASARSRGPRQADERPLRVYEAYAAWHAATLAAWQHFDGACDGSTRQVRIVRITHGFGDSGQQVAGQFQAAVEAGEMLFLSFPHSHSVWEVAVRQPFNWTLTSQLESLCSTAPHSPKQDVRRITCPAACAASKSGLFDEKPGNVPVETRVRWLYRPNEAVEAVVQAATRMMLPQGGPYLAVHFRTAFVGTHHACGCQSTLDVARCAVNLGPSLGLSGGSEPPPLFVASDSAAGIAAFRRAFEGRQQRVFTLPRQMPIEHGMDPLGSAHGAVRIFADMLMLSRAQGLLGACGSTFTGMARMLAPQSPGQHFVAPAGAHSQVHRRAPFSRCVNWRPLEQQLERELRAAFAWGNFSGRDEGKTCGCYAEGEQRYGTCVHACRAGRAELRPSLCPPADNSTL